MTTFIESSAVALAPQTVPCPRCKAQRGEWCRSAGGYQNSAVGFHAARRKAVAHLSDAERYGAYAAMRAEQDARRAEARAALSEPLTGEQQASRAAQCAAWNEICRDVAAEERDYRNRCTDTPRAEFRRHTDGCRCKQTGQVELIPRPAELPVGVLPVTDLAVWRRTRT